MVDAEEKAGRCLWSAVVRALDVLMEFLWNDSWQKLILCIKQKLYHGWKKTHTVFNTKAFPKKKSNGSFVSQNELYKENYQSEAFTIIQIDTSSMYKTEAYVLIKQKLLQCIKYKPILSIKQILVCFKQKFTLCIKHPLMICTKQKHILCIKQFILKQQPPGCIKQKLLLFFSDSEFYYVTNRSHYYLSSRSLF